MGSSMRKARRKLREAIAVAASGSPDQTVLHDTLMAIGHSVMGADGLVGYETVIRSFVANEVANATAQLRSDGVMESVGRRWKLTSKLNAEDVDEVQVRRLKRLRGELRATAELAHRHGRIEEATLATAILSQISAALAPAEAEKVESEPAAT